MNINYNLRTSAKQRQLYIIFHICTKNLPYILIYFLSIIPVGPMANMINKGLVRSAVMILSSGCFSRLNLQQ